MMQVTVMARAARTSTMIADADLNLGAYACIANVVQTGAVYTGVVDNTGGDLSLCPSNDVGVANALTVGDAMQAGVDQKFMTVAASDNVLKAGDATEHTTQSTTYAQICVVGTVPAEAQGAANSVRITWDMKINWVTETGKTKVYVNGVAVGAEKTVTGDANWHAQTDDISNLKAGDIISIWGNITNAARVTSVKADAIKGTETVAHKHTQLTWS